MKKKRFLEEIVFNKIMARAAFTLNVIDYMPEFNMKYSDNYIRRITPFGKPNTLSLHSFLSQKLDKMAQGIIINQLTDLELRIILYSYKIAKKLDIPIKEFQNNEPLKGINTQYNQIFGYYRKDGTYVKPHSRRTK